MSALTERVVWEHRSYSGIGCQCGYYPPYDVGVVQARTRHIAEVTAAEIAAEIRALPTTRTWGLTQGWDSVSLNDVLTVAEGKTNG